MIVKVKQGLLQGQEDTSLTTGKVFYSFQGIPYAEPPIGELRFQPPVPAGSWNGVRDATRARNRCLQLNVPHRKDHQPDESEDCLYLNVFTPEPPNPDAPLKPVMVHIHGGGYHFSDGGMDSGSPDHLVNYDVVFVGFNYRLHIFGFFNLNTESSTGNCGCKDQVMALQWIRENIRCFGGDPENVTIFGTSSGGNAVHLLTVSPLASGLFHKAIVESGTIIDPWIRADQVEAGFAIGRKLGFSGADEEDLVEFLKTQSAEILTEQARIFVATHKANKSAAVSGTMIFVPSIETFSDNAFLPYHPLLLLPTSKPIPTIAGVAEKEGVMVLFGLEDYKTFFSHLTHNLSDLIKFNVPCHPTKVSEIVKKVREHYLDPLGKDATEEEIREKLVEIYSHLYFRSFYTFNELAIKQSAPLYVYMFSYVGNLNESRHWSMNVSGALHADEAEYITLSRHLYPHGIEIDEADRAVIDDLCTAWTNFAKTSDPNPLPDNGGLWHRYNSEEPTYFRFDNTCISEKGKIWNEGLAFWKRIFHHYVDCSDSEIDTTF